MSGSSANCRRLSNVDYCRFKRMKGVRPLHVSFGRFAAFRAFRVLHRPASQPSSPPRVAVRNPLGVGGDTMLRSYGGSRCSRLHYLPLLCGSRCSRRYPSPKGSPDTARTAPAQERRRFRRGQRVRRLSLYLHSLNAPFPAGVAQRLSLLGQDCEPVAFHGVKGFRRGTAAAYINTCRRPGNCLK